MRLLRRGIACCLALLLVALAPGLASYEAVAANRGFGTGSAVPSVQLPSLPVLPNASAPGASVGLGLPQALPTVPAAAIPGAGVALPGAPVPGSPASAIPALPQSSIGASFPGPAAAGAPTAADGSAAAFPSLNAGVERLNAADSPEQRRGVIETLFTGAKTLGGPGEVSASAGGVPAAAPASLARLDAHALKALAVDSKLPQPERQAAVKAIADRSDDPSRLALEEIGTALGGSSSDYEIKRQALRRLAAQGKVLSLPPVSEEHRQELLKKLAVEKPEVAAFDYDGTLEPSVAQATAETGETLKALSDSGVETMILTNRSDRGFHEGHTGILDSVETLSAEQRAAITVASNRGAVIYSFDRDGQAVVVAKAPAWTAAEREGIEDAAGRVAAAMGQAASKKTATDYDFALFLPNELGAEGLAAAANQLRIELALLKINASVTARRGRTSGTPYLLVSKHDKSLGTSLLRKLRERLGRLRDAERHLPRSLRGLGRRLVSLLPAGAPAKSALVVGDYFFGAGAIDSPMIAGAPGALAIAVGGTADPRLDNVFVWPTQGHAAAMEVARAASGPAAPQMEGLNMKAAIGLFSARTLSIIAFLGTTLAYPQIARAAIGDAGFGTVAALGTLVAIAAGPMTGKIVDKMSPRAGMAINAALRAFFLLDMPLFMALGIVNFWTLLLGAIANGWILSAMMTSEGAYLRKLFGFKNIKTINSLLQLNYFGLQIVFGLLLGIGKLVDGHNLAIPFYIGAAVNTLLVLPILWKTIPGDSPVAAAPGAPVKAKATWKDRGAAIKSFFKANGREIAILAASIATFPLWHSALPITAALIWWISRTEGFLTLTENKSVFGAVGLVSLGAFLFYALQSFALPTMAGAVAGAGSSLLLGKLLGALFLGQMISSASLAKLPIARLPFIGRFGIQRLVQGGVLAMVGAWVFAGLFPGSLLAAAAAVGLAAAMMSAASRVTDKGWLSLLGVGLGFLALPALFWGNVPVLLASLLMFGFFYGPASVTLFSYIQSRSEPAKMGAIFGIQGSLFNAAISLGIGGVSLLSTMMKPMYPGTMWAVAAIAAAVGAVFFFATRRLPGLAAGSFHKKEDPR